MRQTVGATRFGWLGDITRYQWMVFLIAWLGRSLANTAFNLFALMLRPALTELLWGTPTAADIGRVDGPLTLAAGATQLLRGARRLLWIVIAIQQARCHHRVLLLSSDCCSGPTSSEEQPVFRGSDLFGLA
jgi:hypothetical protein